jgi:predicted secreted protein
VTVAGLRARTLAFNAATVDVTDTESVGRWREVLEGAGIKTVRITGSGMLAVAERFESGRIAAKGTRQDEVVAEIHFSEEARIAGEGAVRFDGLQIAGRELHLARRRGVAEALQHVVLSKTLGGARSPSPPPQQP